MFEFRIHATMEVENLVRGSNNKKKMVELE